MTVLHKPDKPCSRNRGLIHNGAFFSPLTSRRHIFRPHSEPQCTKKPNQAKPPEKTASAASACRSPSPMRQFIRLSEQLPNINEFPASCSFLLTSSSLLLFSSCPLATALVPFQALRSARKIYFLLLSFSKWLAMTMLASMKRSTQSDMQVASVLSSWLDLMLEVMHFFQQESVRAWVSFVC